MRRCRTNGRLALSSTIPTGEPRVGPGAVSALHRYCAAASPCAGPGIAFVGAGNYASRSLMPAFAKAGASMVSVVANSGVNALQAARKFGIREVSTDYAATLAARGC